MMSISAKEAVILMDDSQYIETLMTAFEAPEESEIHSQQERKRQKTTHAAICCCWRGGRDEAVTVSLLKNSHEQIARKEGCMFAAVREKNAVFLIQLSGHHSRRAAGCEFPAFHRQVGNLADDF